MDTVDLRGFLEGSIGHRMDDQAWPVFEAAINAAAEKKHAAFVARYAPGDQLGVRREPYPSGFDMAWDLAFRLQERWASRAPPVAAFRDEVLGGKLLSPLEVDDWVTSHQASDGPATTWLTFRVPVTTDADASAPLLPIHEPVAVAPQQEFLEYVSRKWSKEVLAWFRKRLTTADVSLSQALEGFEGDVFDFQFRSVPVRREGVLDGLRRVAHMLNFALGWSPGTTETWILTDMALGPGSPLQVRRKPQRPGVSTELTRGEWITLAVHPAIAPPAVFSGPRSVEWITIEAHPAMPPAAVQRAYARERAAGGGGRRERLPTVDTLALADFLLEAPDGTWEQRMDAWNASHPERPYRDRRLFHRDCRRALTAVEGLAGFPFEISASRRGKGERGNDGEQTR